MRVRLGLSLGACLVWLTVAVPGVWASAEESFKEGVEAADLGEWREAEGHFREAIAGASQESERRIFISGAFSRPYLPHFYLGWALFQQGQEHCEAALEAWRVSESQGVVASFRRLYQDLEEGRAVCREVQLPKVAARVRKRLADGDKLLQGLDGSPQATMRRRETGEALAEARRRLEGSLASSDLVAARRVEAEVESRLAELSSWLQQAADQASQRQIAAAALARRELSDAERAERRLLGLLADPGLGDRRHLLPDASLSKGLQERLEGLRRRLGTTVEADQLETLAAEARSITDDLVTLAGRYDAVLADKGPPTTVPTATQAGVGTQIPTASPPTAPRQIPTTVVDSRSTGPSEGTSADGVLESAAELLRWVREAGASGTLLNLQVRRMEGLLVTGGTKPLDPASSSRLDASHGALQLLASAHALARGDADSCLRLLGLRSLSTPSWRAQGHLLAAAAHFMRYQRSRGERARVLRDAALREATLERDRCLRLRPRSVPDEILFSPAFRAFWIADDQKR